MFATLLVNVSTVMFDIIVPMSHCFFSPFPTAVSKLNYFSHVLEILSAPSVLESGLAFILFF